MFSDKVDSLIREIHKYLPRYRMWELLDWASLPPLPELEKHLDAKLAKLKEDAALRGWESKD